ncbi:MetS family NSS transporter small subunit [Tepidibacillus sp. LV47]
MNTSAIIMFIFGATLLWGGLAVSLAIAFKKSKTATTSVNSNASSKQTA